MCGNTEVKIKKMLFAKSKSIPTGTWINIAKLLIVSIEQAKRSTQDKSGFASLVDV